MNEHQKLQEMVGLVEQWGNINSYSQNRIGLEKMLSATQEAFVVLDPDQLEIYNLPNGKGLFLSKRTSAPLQIFFGGHLDTVYPPDHPFQCVERVDEKILRGPGVTDMKGGLVVLLKAVEDFETLPQAKNVGWTIFLNPDEELGSPHSNELLKKCAQSVDLALLFEPTLPDGALVSSRKGSGNYWAHFKGKAAHVGRHPEKGIHAIYPLAHFIAELSSLEGVNVGTMGGGTTTNTVPDFAECTLNLRHASLDTFLTLENKIEESAKKFGVLLQKKSFRPPKPFDPSTQTLFSLLKNCAEKLSISLEWRASGGVCDGNNIASCGVPTIDTLGVHGEHIHSEHECLYVESLLEKRKLVTLLLSELNETPTHYIRREAHVNR